MKVTVQFEAQLREIAGTGSTETELPDGASFLDAVQKVVVDGTDALAERLLAKDGGLQPSLMAFVNDQPVIAATAGTHQVSDGDMILLLPPISGG
jgi:molybdopterin converting factor small subunit